MSHILRMIAEGEHQQQDFKTRIDDSRKIARTLVAFANSDGGRLLIGVKDNGTVSGVRVDEELHMVEAAAELYCKPMIEFRSQVWKADVRSVLEVVVEPSRCRPHRSEDEVGQWNAYLRLEDENIRANAVLSRCWDHRFRADRPPFEYDRNVGRLFRSWRNGKLIGFRQIMRTVRRPPAATEDLLALLVGWGIVEMVLGDRNFMYGLADEQALENLETKGPALFDLSVLPPSPRVRRLKPKGARPVEARALPPDV
ncbi:MAG: ATP-binding protein [Flavobacteriales bacterium]|nr:ATP-binding protein [Flavobacteriales bacterium]